MLEEENTRTININNENGNFENSAIEGEVVLEGEPLVETMSQYFDGQNHELFINQVKSANESILIHKAEVIFDTILAGMFAAFAICNAKKIINGDSDLSIINYVLVPIGVTGLIKAVVNIVKSIKKIIKMNLFMNRQNAYVAENYPDEATLAGVPKGVQKLVKKRNNKKRES